jgi:alginate O-acetyltransferase complex protein AlgI
MSAYLPASAPWAALGAVAGAAAAGLGLNVARGAWARVAAWLVAIGAVAVVERATAADPAGFRMIAICLAGLVGMKAVVSAGERMPLRRWLAWATLWPGMSPNSHESPESQDRQTSPPGGVVCLAAGILMVFAARAAWPLSRIAATTLALVGLSLALHFGLFAILAAAWRRERLFRNPVAFRSLAEFWGRRWNLAFVEMTRRAVYGPVARAAGRRAGLGAAFLFSGLLHEMAISLPVRAGWGLPTAYFALQGLLVMVDGAIGVERWPGWLGRAWCAFWLVAPLPALFHPAFLAGTVWPLLSPA